MLLAAGPGARAAGPNVIGDPTPPVVTPALVGTLGMNGWYTTNVTLNWTVVDPQSLILSTTGCDATTLTSDTTGKTFTCSATSDGGTTTVSKTIKSDMTPPSATATPARPPDANGWYNHAVTVTFAGTDGTSGIASCSAATYSGPDNPTGTLAGSCTDNAGNVGHASFPLKYDSTPPTLSKVTAAAGNRALDLSWVASPDTSVVDVSRTSSARGVKSGLVYSGTGKTFRDTRLKVGARYSYAVTAVDQAGNSVSKALAVTATGALLAPTPAQSVLRAPVLRWAPVRRAAYYNVQLVRGKKILSTWPASNHLRLRRSWVFQGHHYRLHRGVYRWYVWPGFGARSKARYGSVLGGSSFVFSPG
jgi:hypothetical protein